MTPEEKQLLERMAVLSEENNHILRGIRRANRWSFVWKIFYWIIIIGLSYGAYVYVQPYVDQLVKAYDGLRGTTSSVQKAGDQLSSLEKFLNNLPK